MKKILKNYKKLGIMIVTLLLSFTLISQDVHAVFIDDTTINEPDFTFKSTLAGFNYFEASLDYLDNDLTTIITITDLEEIFDLPEFYGGYLIWTVPQHDNYILRSDLGIVTNQFTDLSYIVFNRYTSTINFFNNTESVTPIVTLTSSNYNGIGLSLESVRPVSVISDNKTIFRVKSDYFVTQQTNIDRSILLFEYDYNLYESNLVTLNASLEPNELREYVLFFPEAIDNEVLLRLNNNYTIKYFDITYISLSNGLLKLYQSDKNLRYNVLVTNYTSVTVHFDYYKQLVTDYELGYQAGYQDGKNEGFEEAYDEGYLAGLQLNNGDAYDKGFVDGGNKSFMASIKNWIVPAIFLVLVGGGFITIVLNKRES